MSISTAIPAPFKASRATPELPLNPPLSEILPGEPGDGAAALGFALGWAQRLSQGLVVWCIPGQSLAEEGAPYAPGLAQYGLSLDKLLIVRTRTQAEALWAGEQALKIPAALSLITIAPARKPLSLTATRRLLLLAEKHRTHCILLRFDAATASAAWARWRVRASPSAGVNRELGAPAFAAELLRNRAGPAGFSAQLVWNAHEHCFAALDGDLAAAAGDRSAEARRQSA